VPSRPRIVIALLATAAVDETEGGRVRINYFPTADDRGKCALVTRDGAPVYQTADEEAAELLLRGPIPGHPALVRVEPAGQGVDGGADRGAPRARPAEGAWAAAELAVVPACEDRPQYIRRIES
jgi:hypothetical protein